MNLIELKNVAKYYKSKDNVSVGMKNISVSFNFNEFVAVTGSSGSGKTTLLNVISGLDGYEEGELYLNGNETSHYNVMDWEKYRASNIGFIFQSYNIIDSYTVYQNVLLALEIQNYPRKDRKKRALELIDKVGLLSHKNHKAAKLSGGQKQRTAIARALAKDAPIIVADEPTGNLDSKSGDDIIELLHELSNDKLVIVVTHNYKQVEKCATRKILMEDGNIIEDKKIKEVEKSSNEVIEKTNKMNFLSVMSFAFKNLFSQPKKLIFMLLLQFLVVFTITVVYTNQTSNIKEAGLGSSDYLMYVPKTRMVVQRRDGDILDSDDINYFNSFSEVIKTYQYGQNFLSKQSNITITRSPNDYYGYSLHFIDSATILKDKFIEGRMPVEEEEIIISNSLPYSIGDSIYLRFGYAREDSEILLDMEGKPQYIPKKYTITGIAANRENTIYFSDKHLSKNIFETEIYDYEILRQIYNNFQEYGDRYLTIDEKDYNLIIYNSSTEIENWLTDTNVFGIIDSSLDVEKTDMIYHQTIYISNRVYDSELNKVDVSLKLKQNDNFVDNTYYRKILINKADIIPINELIFEKIKHLAIKTEISEASLSINGRASGNRLLNKIDTNKYRIYYPANIKDPLRPLLVFLYTSLTVIVLTITGAFLYTVLHAVTKNLMVSRKKDFAIYRSIGANKKDLGKLVIIEQIILSITALIFVVLAINIGSYFNMFFVSISDYLTFFDYFILLIIFFLFGSFLGMRFNKKVFDLTVVETLSLDGEEI